MGKRGVRIGVGHAQALHSTGGLRPQAQAGTGLPMPAACQLVVDPWRPQQAAADQPVPGQATQVQGPRMGTFSCCTRAP